MLNRLKEHPVVSLMGLVVSIALVAGFWPQPIVVEVVIAETAPMTVAIQEDGQTRLIDRYRIAAPVAGVASRIELEVGDSVDQGQVLLRITPPAASILDSRSRAQAVAEIASAQAALLAAEQQVDAIAASKALADSEWRRVQALLQRQLIAQDSVDRAAAAVANETAALRSAEFTVEVRRYEWQAKRSRLEFQTSLTEGEASQQVVELQIVRAPVAGEVLMIHHECEGPVEMGLPLLDVGDPAALEVIVDVLSMDAVKIHPGMRVLFERWGGESALEGRVRVVEPVGFTKLSALGVEEQRVWVVIAMTSNAQQWQRLGDGYRVEARFILWHENDVLQLPASSVFRYRDGWAVFVLDAGRARRRQVSTGQRNGLSVQILDGIKAGDLVLDHPTDAIEDGTRATAKPLPGSASSSNTWL